MRYIKYIAALLICCMLPGLLIGCGKEVTPPPVEQENIYLPQMPTHEEGVETVTGPINPLTGEAVNEDISANRPYAVMINNLSAALPQHGVSQADIIYEVLAESGITRHMALFQDISQVGTIGSVRSARHYYIELAQGHDAVYIHAGGSPQAYNLLSSGVIDAADGVRGGPGSNAFYRDKSRSAAGYAYEHTLFTSGQLLTDCVGTLDSVRHTHAGDFSLPLTFSKNAVPEGEDAPNIRATFEGGKRTLFAYDPESGKYMISEYGDNYVDGNTGEQVGVTNVLFLFTDVARIAGDSAGRVNVRTTGTGTGGFACGGKFVKILWSRDSVTSPFTYTLEDGTPFDLGVGKTYICIMPMASELVLNAE